MNAFLFLFCISPDGVKYEPQTKLLPARDGTTLIQIHVSHPFTGTCTIEHENKSHQTTIDIRFCDTFASQKRFLLFSFCSWWICGRFLQTSWPVWGYVRERFDVFCFVFLFVDHENVCEFSVVVRSLLNRSSRFCSHLEHLLYKKEFYFVEWKKKRKRKTIVNMRPFPFFA